MNQFLNPTGTRSAVFLRHAKKRKFLRSAVIRDAGKDRRQYGGRKICKGASRSDAKTERGRIPERFEERGGREDAADTCIISVKGGDDVNGVQNKAGKRSDEAHIKPRKRAKLHSAALSGDLVFRAKRPKLASDQEIIKSKYENGGNDRNTVYGGRVVFRIRHEQGCRAHNAENSESDVRNEKLADLPLISLKKFL